MKSLFLILLILFSYTYSYTQKVVRIDFYDKIQGDLDEHINFVLNKNGYNSFVKYLNTPDKKYDYLIKYAKESQNEVAEFKLELFDSNDVLINKSQILNLGEKSIKKGIEKLFNRNDFVANIDRKKLPQFKEIKYEFQKIDSAKYAIIVKGEELVSKERVEGAFLDLSKSLMQNFEYYYEIGKHKYYSGIPNIFKMHLVFGVIIPNSISEKPEKSIIKPAEFDTKFGKWSKE